VDEGKRFDERKRVADRHVPLKARNMAAKGPEFKASSGRRRIGRAV
jgi:hypothetical protein